MTSKVKFKVALPFIWMGLIFYASSRQKVAVTQDFWISFLIFKSLHLIEYGILFLLWRINLNFLSSPNVWAAVLSIMYGAVDEMHQTFVPTRTGTVRDVFIDAFGVILTLWLVWPFLKNKLERR